MSKHRDWHYDDDYRDKAPRRVEKDKFEKHKKAIYDMIDDEDDSDYFTDDYSYDNDYDYDEQ